MRKRQAFTLVEMMVSMALVIFIMVLLSQAFVASMQTFRQLKGIGDMEEKLRTAAAMMRRDLGAYYVLDKDGQAFRLSNKGPSNNGPFNKGPAGSGYFRIIHGSPIMRPSALNPYPRNTYEEWDGDLIPSARVTDHAMAFTIRLIGNTRENYITADISTDPTLATAINSTNAYKDSGTTVGQMAEIAYFLKPSEIIVGGARLFGLYRRQQLVVANNSNITSLSSSGITTTNLRQSNAYAEISCKPDVSAAFTTVHFNNATDLTVPQRRFGMNPLTGSPYDSPPTPNGGDGGDWLPIYPGPPVPIFPTGLNPSGFPALTDINYIAQTPTWYGLPISYGSLAGADLLVNDVISFEIKLLIDDTNALGGTRTRLSGAGLGGLPNLDPYVDLFDSMVYLNPYASLPDPVQPLKDSNGNLLLKSPNPRYDYTVNQMANPDTGGTTLMPRYLGDKPCVFDTWSNVKDGTYDYSNWSPKTTGNTSTTLPLSIRILALQITLRIWDKNTQQTRQMTFVQPM